MKRPSEIIGMKDWSELKGSGQNEALVNELKGNLFEYLVGSLYARELGMEARFVNDFDQQNGGQSKSVLLGYQEWLRKTDLSLYNKLPSLAQAALNYTLEHTQLLSEKSWQRIIVVGKMASGMGDDSLAESDLLLVDDRGEKLGLSLKLVKKNAFVNTKSGGIRSFVAKYFGAFKNVSSAQRKVEERLDQSFVQMLGELYSLMDLDVAAPIASQRSIDPTWVEQGLPELPGDLEPEARSIVHSHYHRVSLELENVLRGFYLEDRQLFLTCLTSLLGFGFKDIRQLTCYHGDSYDKAHFSYETYEELVNDLENLSFARESGDKKMKSGFEMNFSKHTLQIRLKPMNKFTVSGLKVNCSVKVKESRD